MKIGIKIALTFFTIAFSSMMIISIISYLRAKESLQTQSFEKLTAVREMKAEQIEDYFEIIRDQIITSAENSLIINAMQDLEHGYYNINKEFKISDRDFNAIEQKLNAYIEKEYLSRLNQNLKTKANLANEISNEKESVILHHLYYSSNPNKIGEKLNLNTAGDASSYSNAHAKYHPSIKSFLEKFGYYDIFLIDNTGNVIYSVYKELDFATSLKTGPFKNTNLAKAFTAANNANNKGFVKLVDFEPYHPSYNAHASFIACPIFKDDKKIGVLAFQMPIDNINDIMTSKKSWSKVGLGKTGETYIVGKDFAIRNQSRFLIEDSVNYFKMLQGLHVDNKVIESIKNIKSTVGLQQVKTEGTEAALSGISDTRIFNDYRGVSVLSAFKPLNIPEMNWVIMSEIDEEEAFAPVFTLKKNITVAFILLLLLVVAVSYFVSREITRPLNELTIDSLELAKGNLDVEIKINKKDEIGILANSFKKMQSSITKLITDLRDINHSLEDKVIERTSEVVKQKDIIQEKQNEIVDSIHYARRIQSSVLPSNLYLNKNLPEHFVLFKPQSIVSGDFYWATRVLESADNEKVSGERFYFMVCDSTGHGVPGAFMSLLNISFLNEAINEKKIKEPHEILNHVRKRLIKNISQDGAQDGMDGIVLCFDKVTGTITYSAAHNAPIIVRNNELIEFNADKMPIGKGIREDSFTIHQFDYKNGDMLYMYTDGYADQFGGPKGKKFKYKTLNNLLVEISNKPVLEQRQILNDTFDNWKGELEQIDDVCVVGIRLSLFTT
jgi:serine phosphatase RsbU (regulator of sigma subunit)